MKKFHYIYTEGDHKWGVVVKDPDKPSYLIDTNEYVVIKNDKMILTDPGGIEIFPSVLSSLSSEVNPANIEYIFASHQDPDIISSLALWLDIEPKIKCFTSYLWTTFLPHFGGNDTTFIALPDKGSIFSFHGLDMEFIPAHYLHSAGNFHLYDKKAKIFFSGDIGAGLLPLELFGEAGIYVQDFDSHIKYCKGFHQRWMGSNEAKLDWCERVSKLSIDLLCPQHGLIYKEKNIERFINWFAELKVGVLAS